MFNGEIFKAQRKEEDESFAGIRMKSMKEKENERKAVAWIQESSSSC